MGHGKSKSGGQAAEQSPTAAPTQDLLFSVWLTPDRESQLCADMKALITDLSKSFGGPVFAPHVTLLSFPAASEEEAKVKVQSLASRLQQFEVHFGDEDDCIKLDAWNQDVILLAEETDVLKSANIAARQVVGLEMAKDVVSLWPPPCNKPHLSLTYGSHDRENIVAHIRSKAAWLFKAKWQVTQLALWRITSPTLEGVAQWIHAGSIPLLSQETQAWQESELLAPEGKAIDAAQIPGGADSIVRAWYGRKEKLWSDAGSDVTEKVKELIRINKPVIADNAHFGDPYPRRAKALAIQIRYLKEPKLDPKAGVAQPTTSMEKVASEPKAAESSASSSAAVTTDETPKLVEEPKEDPKAKVAQPMTRMEKVASAPKASESIASSSAAVTTDESPKLIEEPKEDPKAEVVQPTANLEKLASEPKAAEVIASSSAAVTKDESPKLALSSESRFEYSARVVAKSLLSLKATQRPASEEKLNNFILRCKCFAKVNISLGRFVRLMLEEVDPKASLHRALAQWLPVLNGDCAGLGADISDELLRKRVLECLKRLQNSDSWESMSFLSQLKWLADSAVVTLQCSASEVSAQMKSMQIITSDSNIVSDGGSSPSSPTAPKVRIAYNEGLLETEASRLSEEREERNIARLKEFVQVTTFSMSLGHGMGAKVRSSKLGELGAVGLRWCQGALAKCNIDSRRMRYQYKAWVRPKASKGEGKGKGKGKGNGTNTAPVDTERHIDFTCQLLVTAEEAATFESEVKVEARKDLDGILGVPVIIKGCVFPEEEKTLEAYVLNLQTQFQSYIDADREEAQLRIWLLDGSPEAPEMPKILEMILGREPSLTLEYEQEDNHVLAALKHTAYQHQLRLETKTPKPGDKRSLAEVSVWPTPWILKNACTVASLEDKIKRASQALNAALSTTRVSYNPDGEDYGDLADDGETCVTGLAVETEKLERGKQYAAGGNHTNWTGKKARQERRALERQLPGANCTEERANLAKQSGAKTQIRREKAKYIDQKRSHNRDFKHQQQEEGIGRTTSTQLQ